MDPMGYNSVQHSSSHETFSPWVKKGHAMQLRLFQPQARPQQPKISASNLRTTRSAQLCSKGKAIMRMSIWTIVAVFLVVSLTISSHKSFCKHASIRDDGFQRSPSPTGPGALIHLFRGAQIAAKHSCVGVPSSTSFHCACENLFPSSGVNSELKPKNSLALAGGRPGCLACICKSLNFWVAASTKEVQNLRAETVTGTERVLDFVTASRQRQV